MMQNLPFDLGEPRLMILLLSLPPVIWLGVLSARARPRDKGRIAASTLLRAIIVTLVVLALAGLEFVSSQGPLNVVFLVDRSASISQASETAATDYVKHAIAGMGSADRAGVVLFGEGAVVDRAVAGGTDWQPVGKTPARLATNIGEAIQIGTALFPEGGARRLVLLTDGAETAGRAADMARSAALSGIQLSVVPLGGQSRNEVAVDKVASPQEVPGGQRYNVRVLLKSTSDRQATVTLQDNGAPAGRQDVRLTAGDNVVTFNLTAGAVGFHTLTAHVDSVDDTFSENNTASSFSIVQRPPSVLLVAAQPADSEPLQRALKASGVDAAVVTPDGVPRKLENLAAYDAVVLSNVSSAALGLDAQQTLQSFVRDQGHGLVMLGGENGYGAGGYLRSPLEDVLPVSMDVRTTQQRATIAMTFVVDKSGSMGKCHCGGQQQFDPSMRTEFGDSKIEIVKDAINKATALLNSSDQVGIVSFDETPHWLANLQPMSALRADGVSQSLAPVAAQGGTNMSTGLQSAIDALSASNAKLKHIILLSDGWTQQGDFTALLNAMDQNHITLSSFAAGDGAGAILKDLASKGGGEFYAADDVKKIPDMVLKETVRLTGSYFVEGSVRPEVVKKSDILKGLDPATLPNLLGYDGATLKPNADMVLKSPQGDPLLAQWQYGLGRSVAWTSDAKGRWATDWVRWPLFSQFVGQMVGWTMPQGEHSGLQATFTPGAPRSGKEDVAVRVESTDNAGAPRNLLQTALVLTSTGGITSTISIVQQSPGVYQGVVPGLAEGVYGVRVEQRDPATGLAVANQQTGLVVPYGGEYRLTGDGDAASRALMADLVQLGGGKMLSLADPAAAFTHDIVPQPLRIPLWPWLLLVAMLLFPVDVAVRRLTITWADVRRFRKGAGQAV
ncbi:MAG: VWA domain-containing protein [Chloroflexota bacterium]|nr:VWA domain-containing protein [Chloroflexota bacterium]